jgi:hypothetical protein
MLYKKMNTCHANFPSINDIQNYFYDFKIAGKGILTTKKINITLKKKTTTIISVSNHASHCESQQLLRVGGGKEKIKLEDGTKYKYFIDEIIPYSNKENIVSFIYSDGSKGDCVTLIVNTKESGKTQAILQGISNDENCVKCLDKKKKYKVGDILMQITIKLLKTSKDYSHIKTIILHDTSIKRCYDIGIPLRYLKMITDGRTYYSKYGFKPKKIKEDYDKKSTLMTDYKKFKYNKELFNTERNLIRQDIADVIKESDIDDDGILFYKKIVRPYLKKHKIIDTSIFIKDMLSLALEEQEEEDKKIICNFIWKICENLYKKIGYKKYFENVWILKL